MFFFESSKKFSFLGFFIESIVQRLNQGSYYRAESIAHNTGVQGPITKIFKGLFFGTCYEE